MNQTVALLFALASAAAAQAPQAQPAQSFAGVVRLNKAPISNEVLKVKLPRPVERQLSNGIKLLVVESHRVPTITLRLTTPSGDFRDPDGIPGVSDATAALIRLGTKTRTSKDIAETLAELGASVQFSSGADSGTIFVSSLTQNFDATLGVLADMLANPTFPAGRTG